ncbi:hypothetical protein PLICRDRAFT_306180 [Plicaturopsis crispa FD-325 SS-3]|nr:hypothetical protein PLICRDRAFT_306180 [Plicaturopsis crispa FD-325 SS-3]
MVHASTSLIAAAAVLSAAAPSFAHPIQRDVEVRGLGSLAKGAGGQVAGGVAGGAANAVVTQGIQALEGLFSRELELQERGIGSLAKGAGGQVAGGVAGGAANAVVTQGIQALEGLFSRELDLNDLN